MRRSRTPRAGRSRPRADAPVLPARHRRARRIRRGQGGPAAGRLRPRDRRQVDARHVGVRRHAAAARQARHEGDADGAARQRRRAARGRRCAREQPRAGGQGPRAAARHRLPARRASSRRRTAAQMRSEVRRRSRKRGATATGIDLRGTALGDRRRRVRRGAAVRADGHARLPPATRGQEKRAVAAAAGDGAITLPVALLVDNGTSGAAELFAAALAGNKRARSSASARSDAPHGRSSSSCPTAAALC